MTATRIVPARTDSPITLEMARAAAEAVRAGCALLEVYLERLESEQDAA